MPGQQQSSKGNPAAKRMGNARLKARRAECWARGEARKAKRRAENEARHRANIERGGTRRQLARQRAQRRVEPSSSSQ